MVAKIQSAGEFLCMPIPRLNLPLSQKGQRNPIFSAHDYCPSLSIFIQNYTVFHLHLALAFDLVMGVVPTKLRRHLFWLPLDTEVYSFHSLQHTTFFLWRQGEFFPLFVVDATERAADALQAERLQNFTLFFCGQATRLALGALAVCHSLLTGLAVVFAVFRINFLFASLAYFHLRDLTFHQKYTLFFGEKQTKLFKILVAG